MSIITRALGLVGLAPAAALRGAQAEAEILKSEISRARVGSVRTIFGGHPADNLSPGRLAALLRSAEDGDAEAYLELAEQMEERDLHYLSVLGTRKRQVSQLPATIEAATDAAEDQRIADFLRDWLTRDALEAEIFDILDAVGKGFSASEMVWQLDGPLWYPDAIRSRLPQWFEFDRDTGEELLLRGGYAETSVQAAPLPPAKFIVHKSAAKSGLPIRGGFARAVAWAYLFKNFALKDWVAFADVYGMPFRLGKYPAQATEEQIDTLFRAVVGMGQDAAAVIPDTMMVDLVDGKVNGSADLYERLCDYLDRQISKAVLGQTATTDADTGGLGSGKEHGDVRADIERADAKALQATLQRDLIMPMVRLNFGERKAWPKIRIGREAQEDLEQLTRAVSTLVPLGLRVQESVIRDKLGLPDPEPDAEILAAPESGPVSAFPDPDATTPASARGPRFLQLLSGRYDDVIIAAAARLAADEADAIDLAADAMVHEEGRRMLAPIIEPLMDAIAAGAGYDEVRGLLADVAGEMDEGELAKMLEQACTISRIAGNAGA